MSAEAKDYAETTELAQEIEDMNFNYTYADAVALWNTIDLDAYFVEYEYQQEDFDLFVKFADLREGLKVLHLGCGPGWVASSQTSWCCRYRRYVKYVSCIPCLQFLQN